MKRFFLLIILLLVLYLLLKKEIIEKFYDNSKNVIMTTYFCKKKDPQRSSFAPCDDFVYIKPWYNSVKKLGLNGIIFHDGMSKKFIEQYENENIKFEFVNSSEFEYSLNDQRFLIYYNYLINHPEIKNVFMTDGNDITIVKSPFNRFNKICVGSENHLIHKSSWMHKKINIFNCNKFKLNYSINDIIYNAGILGGKRKEILNFLNNMIIIFKNMNSTQKTENLNMIVFNYIIYNNLNKNVISGFPLHSVYKKYENNRKDVYFIHK